MFESTIKKHGVDNLDTHEKKRAQHLGSEGKVLFQRGDIDGVLKKFLEAYEQDPSNGQICNDLAVCFWQQGDSGLALSYLSKGLAVLPDYRPLIINGGHILGSCGRYEDAHALFSSYLKDHPEDQERAD